MEQNKGGRISFEIFSHFGIIFIRGSVLYFEVVFIFGTIFVGTFPPVVSTFGNTVGVFPPLCFSLHAA